MHHPIGFGALSSTSTIVNEGLLEANALVPFSSIGIHRLVNARRLPKSRPSDPIRPYAVLVLSPSLAKEVPFLLPAAAPICNFLTTLIYIYILHNLQINTFLTGKIPWVVFVNINLLDEFKADGSLLNFPAKVKAHQFFVRRMESESRQRDLLLAVAYFRSIHIHYYRSLMISHIFSRHASLN